VVVDYLCSAARQQSIFYLWRPVLADADDDMVLELAVAAACQAIVTHNVRDFRGAARFNVAVWTPHELLRCIGVSR
jgi:predicted nucleic acid-binding protein